MRRVKFTNIIPGCDRQHYLTEDDILVVLSRLPGEVWQRLKAARFNDRSRGAQVLGYVNEGRREIAICALPPRVSLTRFLTRWQNGAEFGAQRGTQWPQLAVRRYMLYDVFLHELGHLQLVDGNRRSERLRFALERHAEEFADKWRRQLWSAYFDHPDPVHNAPASVLG